MCQLQNSEWKQQVSDYLAKDNEGIDVYFDCVGGEILSFILTKMNKFGHVAACGAISGYNDNKAFAASWPFIITNSLNVQGFIVGNFAQPQKLSRFLVLLLKKVKLKPKVLTMLKNYLVMNHLSV